MEPQVEELKERKKRMSYKLKRQKKVLRRGENQAKRKGEVKINMKDKRLIAKCYAQELRKAEKKLAETNIPRQPDQILNREESVRIPGDKFTN